MGNMKKADFFSKVNQWSVFLLIISLNFGEILNVRGIAFSNILAVLTFVFVLISLVSSHLKINYINGKRWIFGLCIIWGVYDLLQLFWVQDYTLWFSGSRMLFINLYLCILLCVVINSKEEYLFQLKSIVFSWGIQITAGAYEIIFSKHFISEGVSYWDRNHVRTFFGNPNDCATWIVLCFFGLFLYMCIKKYLRLFMLIALGITTFAVYATGSRACTLGMVVFIIALILGKVLIYFSNRKINKWKQLIQLLFYFIVLMVSAIIIVLLFFEREILDNFILQYISSVGNTESDLLRLTLTEGSMRVAINYMLAGAGAFQSINYLGINPHNFLLEILADYGIFIFLIIVSMLLNIFWKIFDLKLTKDIRSFCFSFFLSFLVISISSSSINRLRLTWIIIIMMFLYSYIFSNQNRERVEKNELYNYI